MTHETRAIVTHLRNKKRELCYAGDYSYSVDKKAHDELLINLGWLQIRLIPSRAFG